MSTNRSKDRSSLCSFTFVDGRHCRIPRRVDHPYLCAFHARKDAQALAGEAAGKDIAYHLSGSYVSACDLSSALGRLFVRHNFDLSADPPSPVAEPAPAPTPAEPSDASPTSE